MSDAPLDRSRALQRDDHREDFDCGSEPLNDYLQRSAWTNQQAGAERVVGYCTLAYGCIEHKAAAARIRQGLAKHPIPVMLLARLAVDRCEQAQGSHPNGGRPKRPHALKTRKTMADEQPPVEGSIYYPFLRISRTWASGLSA